MSDDLYRNLDDTRTDLDLQKSAGSRVMPPRNILETDSAKYTAAYIKEVVKGLYSADDVLDPYGADDSGYAVGSSTLQYTSPNSLPNRAISQKPEIRRGGAPVNSIAHFSLEEPAKEEEPEYDNMQQLELDYDDIDSEPSYNEKNIFTEEEFMSSFAQRAQNISIDSAPQTKPIEPSIKKDKKTFSSLDNQDGQERRSELSTENARKYKAALEQRVKNSKNKQQEKPDNMSIQSEFVYLRDILDSEKGDSIRQSSQLERGLPERYQTDAMVAERANTERYNAERLAAIERASSDKMSAENYENPRAQRARNSDETMQSERTQPERQTQSPRGLSHAKKATYRTYLTNEQPQAGDEQEQIPLVINRNIESKPRKTVNEYRKRPEQERSIQIEDDEEKPSKINMFAAVFMLAAVLVIGVLVWKVNGLSTELNGTQKQTVDVAQLETKLELMEKQNQLLQEKANQLNTKIETTEANGAAVGGNGSEPEQPTGQDATGQSSANTNAEGNAAGTEEKPNEQAQSAGPGGTYVVKNGDTLWTLAEEFYGDGNKYKKIAEANNLGSKTTVVPGDKLVIPE